MTTWQTRGRCEQCKMPWYVHAPAGVAEDPGVLTEYECICGGRIVIEDTPIFEASDARLE